MSFLSWPAQLLEAVWQSFLPPFDAGALLELEVGLGRRARLGRGRPGRDGARHRGGDRQGCGPHHLRSPRRGTGLSCAAGRIGERALERKSDLAIEPIAPRYAGHGRPRCGRIPSVARPPARSDTGAAAAVATDRWGSPWTVVRAEGGMRVGKKYA